MVPKYERIRQELLEEIKSNVFSPGDRFYSEADIKNKYSVSSITAVKVLNELTNSGHVYRIQGKGTFVSKAKMSQLIRFSDVENHSPSMEEIKVIEIKEENDPFVLKKLELEATDSYYTVVRVRSVGGEPFMLQVTHLPKQFIAEPVSGKMQDCVSIYERIRKDFGIDFFSLASVEIDEIIYPGDERIKENLQLKENEPVVKQEKITYLNDQSVAEYVVAYKHWKFYKIKIEVDAR